MQKPIKILIMSVGKYADNHTVRLFKRMGGLENCVVCLPDQFKCNAESYIEKGVEVFLYDEKRYINDEFEYFGFRKRNCGGVGRQGIAEAVERYGDDYLCFQVDDDYRSFDALNTETHRRHGVKSWEMFQKMVYAFDEFYNLTGCELAAKTGATPMKQTKFTFWANRKIFNNFIMRKGNTMNFSGFAALCSDDQRYNLYRNLLQITPMLSTSYFVVMFAQNQGDRKDGNAVLYNSDCSWKKSFALKMMMPWCVAQYIKKEENRALFREHIEVSKLYPPILLEKDGKIVGKV